MGMSQMKKLNELICKLCPHGFEYKKIKDVYPRLRGTPITAAKMKEIESPDGEIRVFAGGKTVINAKEADIPNANIIRVPAVFESAAAPEIERVSSTTGVVGVICSLSHSPIMSGISG